jgi:PAS domain S-box-containing protein
MTERPLSSIVNDISILYEISLAIGTSLDLRENSAAFLKTVMARKGLSFASVWIRSDYMDETGAHDRAHCVYASPESSVDSTECPLDHPLFTAIPKGAEFVSYAFGDAQFASLIQEHYVREGAYALFSLPGIGIVKLCDMTRPKRYEHKELNQLSGIMAKFSTSLEACLVYKRMRREIAGRRKSEEARLMLVSLIENSTDFIGMASLDGQILYINEAGLRMVGLESLHDAQQKSLHDLFSPDDRRTFETELLPRGDWRSEIYLRRFTTSHTVPVDMHAFVIKEPETGRPMAIATISRDISLRKSMEEEQVKREKLESLGVLAGGIAHDFNNLLTAVLGNISMAKADCEDREDLYSTLDGAEKASLRARDLTQQLLTFSKGGEPVKESISIERSIRDATSFALRGSRVKPVFAFAPGLPLVNADEGQISQVVHNLVINADQAMPAGGSVEVRCDVAVIEPGNTLPLERGRYVRIMIRDNGTGIPQEHLQKIFDPYFTTKQKGSGLGLATVYSIVKRHGGHVAVESLLGSGTTFSVYLPIAHDAHLAPELKAEPLTAGTGRVLVMDDEEIVRSVVRKMLETLGYRVDEVVDGQEAITRYTQALSAGAPYNLVIMDLTIPGGMGGKTAIEKLREIDPGIKAIVSSGYSNDPVMAGYRSYGFSGMAAKPFKVQDLARVVRDVIGKQS